MDYRILIVEDELIVAYHMAAVLRDAGYPNTRIAKNLSEAITAIGNFDPHLVLSDIMLGAKPDGIKLGMHIRNEREIPFIYITSHGSIDMIREASKTRPNSYLVKPFKVPDLIAGIELALMNTSTSPKEDNKVWIRDGASLIPFSIGEITVLKAEENYTAVHTISGGKPTLVRHLLSGVLNMLPEGKFVRVHKSFVINRVHIIGMKHDSITIGDLSIPIGRTYKQEIQKLISSQHLA